MVFAVLGILGPLFEMGLKTVMLLVIEKLDEMELMAEKIGIELLMEMVMLAEKKLGTSISHYMAMRAVIQFLIPEIEEVAPVLMLHLED